MHGFVARDVILSWKIRLVTMLSKAALGGFLDPQNNALNAMSVSV